ncbi:MAG: methyl-accepting chemotaxis protein [Planctomycetes bacterium]|nr:methyl-accepting chemotaxis protein [Planctomycetota bacterium]
MKQNDTTATYGDTKREWSKKDRRKQYIINPAFQWKYISLVAGGVFVASTLMSILLYSMVYYQARERLLHLAQSHPLQNTFGLLIFSGAFALVMAGGFAAWTMIITHRIGGPIHVMMNYFADLSNSKIPRVRPLRDKDEFKSFHAAFKRAADSLRCDREAEVKMLGEALELAQQVNEGSNASDGSSEELVTKLRSLQLHAARTIDAEGELSETSTSKPRANSPQTNVAV